MNVASAAVRLHAVAEDAFARALRDPAVVGAATAMNVDLSDRRTVLRLAARARAVLEVRPEEVAIATAYADREPDRARLSAISNHHARAAIRTYLAVSRLSDPSR